MTYKEQVAVCSEIRTKHIIQCVHHGQVLNVNVVMRKVTARL
jgi:hypothetical protein